MPFDQYSGQRKDVETDMKKELIIRAVLGFFFIIVTCGAALADVTFWGSTTCQKRFLEPGAEALARATGIKIKVYGVGTGKGMLALFEGKTSAAISSNVLEESIKSAQKVRLKAGKAPVAVPDGLQYHTITEDVIVPVVHRNNPVVSLTWENLADLHTGKIKQWKELGGKNLPVRVVTSHAGSSTKAVFQKMVMKNAEYVASAITVTSTRLEINRVSKEEGGICAVSKGFFDLNPGKTKIIKTDPIVRPLGIITIGPPAEEVQKIIDFFRSPEGQRHIR